MFLLLIGQKILLHKAFTKPPPDGKSFFPQTKQYQADRKPIMCVRWAKNHKSQSEKACRLQKC